MAYEFSDPKSKDCTNCGLDTQACPSTPVTPAPANGLNGDKFTGFTHGTNYDPATGTTSPVQTINVQDGKYYVGSTLNMMAGQTMPLFKWLLEKYPTVSRLLFNIDEWTSPDVSGDRLITGLTFKEFPNREVKQAFDGKSFLFSEYDYEEPDVYVVRDEANSVSFLIGDANGYPISFSDPKYKDMFMPGDTILIKANDPADTEDPECCSGFETRTIVSVSTEDWTGPHGNRSYIKIEVENSDLPNLHMKGYNLAPNAVKPEFNDGVKVYPGDTVLRLYGGRNSCETIIGSTQDTPYRMKQSFIQFVDTSWTMTTAELNMSYDTMDGVNTYLKTKLHNINLKLVTEIANAFWMGTNRTPDNSVSYTRPGATATSTLPSTTMGVLPTIFEAHAKNPSKGIIKSARKLMLDEDKVRLILETILTVQNSGAVNPSSPVTMVMDQKAYATFLKMNNAWNKLVGQTVTSTDNSIKKFQVPVIETPNGRVEYMMDYSLTRLLGNTGNILFLPKELIVIAQRDKYKWDPSSNSIQAMTPGFRFEEITNPVIHGHECQVFDVFTEFAILLGMADSGAWSMLSDIN